MKNKKKLLDSAALLLEQIELNNQLSENWAKKIAEFLERVENARRD